MTNDRLTFRPFDLSPHMTRSLIQRLTTFTARLHRDERGTVSIMTVFALFMFTILLVKVVNVGRHLDDKLRRQNAADAAAYSGSVVMARGMNTLAFTNHLEAEVFALDAYMRTAVMQNGNGDPAVEGYTPAILAKWEEVGRVFERFGGQAGYEKFQKLGAAIQQKVPLERDLVRAFTEMSVRHAELTLPVLEYILHAGEADQTGGFGGGADQVPLGGFIPRFQRALVRTTPMMADIAASEIARRHGRAGESLRPNGESMSAHLWRTDVYCFLNGNESDPQSRTLPAIDPSLTGTDTAVPELRDYHNTAVAQRKALAEHYLEVWIRDWQGKYFSYAHGDRNNGHRPGRSTAKMSQYTNLWRSFACAHLRVLLEVEYPGTNLPHVIRNLPPDEAPNDALERDYRFISVTYWKHVREKFPGLFKNRYGRDPGFDAQTFAAGAFFIPKRRYRCCPWATPYYVRVRDPDGTLRWELRWRNHYDGWPGAWGPFRNPRWDLFNQNWHAKLVPAATDNLAAILQQTPPGDNNFRAPNFNGTDPGDIHRISKH